MSVDVRTQIEIALPASLVAEYAMDPDNACEWYVNIESVEWLTERPAQVGSQMAFVAHFLGRRMAYTYEVVELEPGRRMVMRTAEGPFPMQTSYELEELGPERCRVHMRNSGDPVGMSRLMAPMMSVAVRRANNNDLHNLKAILEGRYGGAGDTAEYAVPEELRGA